MQRLLVSVTGLAPGAPLASAVALCDELDARRVPLTLLVGPRPHPEVTGFAAARRRAGDAVLRHGFRSVHDDARPYRRLPVLEARLAPKDDAERARGTAAGLDLDRLYDADGLVASDNTMFVATGVTDGGLVEGVRRHGPWITTESIVLRSRSGTVRRIRSDHVADRWL